MSSVFENYLSTLPQPQLAANADYDAYADPTYAPHYLHVPLACHTVLFLVTVLYSGQRGILSSWKGRR